jgi:hypothetical protein
MKKSFSSMGNSRVIWGVEASLAAIGPSIPADQVQIFLVNTLYKKSAAAFINQKRCREDRNPILLGIDDDRLIGLLPAGKDHATGVHDMGRVNDMGIEQRCDEERAGFEMKEHFADEVAGETVLYLMVKAVISAKQLRFNNFLYIPYSHVRYPAEACFGNQSEPGVKAVPHFPPSRDHAPYITLIFNVTAIEHYESLVNHCPHNAGFYCPERFFFQQSPRRKTGGEVSVPIELRDRMDSRMPVEKTVE